MSTEPVADTGNERPESPATTRRGRFPAEPGTTRRGLFTAAGGLGAGALLAACGDDGPGAPDNDLPAGVIAEVDEVEVGGGYINAGEQVVVTQPREGDFRGFSAICTHEGCTVSDISDGTINCRCHGSRYSIEDGSIVQAAMGETPETQDPLPQVELAEDNGTIVRA